METLKIVLTLLAIQAVLYDLCNIYQKWNMGYHDIKGMINSFRSWTEANDTAEFGRGYYACQEKYKNAKCTIFK